MSFEEQMLLLVESQQNQLNAMRDLLMARLRLAQPAKYQMTEEVERAVVQADDLDEAQALLKVAREHYEVTGAPITMDEAIATLHRVAAGIEAMG